MHIRKFLTPGLAVALILAATVPSALALASSPTISPSASSGSPASFFFLGVNVAPYVTADPYFVLRGGSTRFIGRAFAPFETVTISGFAAPFSVAADAAGNFATGPIGVGYAGGDRVVRFSGSISGSMARNVVIHVASYAPWIVLDDYYLGAGNTVVVHGAGFGANEAVQIFLGGVNEGVVSSNAAGGWRATFILPEAGRGAHPIVAQGLSSGTTASAVLTEAF